MPAAGQQILIPKKLQLKAAERIYGLIKAFGRCLI